MEDRFVRWIDLLRLALVALGHQKMRTCLTSMGVIFGALYGYRMIHALLLRRGPKINIKRVRRLWIEVGLKRPESLIVARLVGRRGAPTRIRSDNGSRFICEASLNWLPAVGAEPLPVAAGSPRDNGYLESVHSRLRDEFLERVKFEEVADARATVSW
jgi:transposase InsO family protein